MRTQTNAAIVPHVIAFLDVVEIVEQLSVERRYLAPNGLELVVGTFRADGYSSDVVLAVSPISGDAEVLKWTRKADEENIFARR